MKFSKASFISFSDYQDPILENLKKNINYNQIIHNHKSAGFEDDYKNINDNIDICPNCYNRFSIENLDWRNYESYEKKFDIIIGSELIYQGGYIEELVKLMKKILLDGI